ncbi:hypothetical protein PPERSA_02106 [Pseudocohnilembus persalinus]|uniref:Uncharacterized protein n=1 Tax=Pseudocohnilembus persalinus TaxID=266149 RepID=A0A0V0Q7W9_PSEPJ|nr:hypothetical protein PPERSA_02106 [Pseudocohnilembus persalinus]|eukprot:KRW98329.1 hypothetical protein PPERSA_02106 [Pseudocohnilembus persalinus]
MISLIFFGEKLCFSYQFALNSKSIYNENLNFQQIKQFKEHQEEQYNKQIEKFVNQNQFNDKEKYSFNLMVQVYNNLCLKLNNVIKDKQYQNQRDQVQNEQDQNEIFQQKYSHIFTIQKENQNKQEQKAKQKNMEQEVLNEKLNNQLSSDDDDGINNHKGQKKKQKKIVKNTKKKKAEDYQNQEQIQQNEELNFKPLTDKERRYYKIYKTYSLSQDSNNQQYHIQFNQSDIKDKQTQRNVISRNFQVEQEINSLQYKLELYQNTNKAKDFIQSPSKMGTEQQKQFYSQVFFAKKKDDQVQNQTIILNNKDLLENQKSQNDSQNQEVNNEKLQKLENEKQIQQQKDERKRKKGFCQLI